MSEIEDYPKQVRSAMRGQIVLTEAKQKNNLESRSLHELSDRMHARWLVSHSFHDGGLMTRQTSRCVLSMVGQTQ